MQAAGIRLSEIEKDCRETPVLFLKKHFEFTKIREAAHQPNFKSNVGIVFTKLSAMAGIKSEMDFETKVDLLKFVKTQCNELSLEEIYKAFELERFHVYKEKTEHFGLFNTDYVASVLSKYKSWKQETKIQHNISSGSILQLPELSDSEKQNITIDGIVRVFNEFRDTEILSEPNAWIFDYLYRITLIRSASTPGEQFYYQKKYSQAQKEVEEELKIKPVKSTTESKNLKNEIEKVIQGNSSKILLRCKKIILAEYFKNLISKEINIYDEIIKANEKVNRDSS